MSVASRVRAVDPKTVSEAEARIRFYRGFAWGTLWGGVLTFLVWVGHALLGQPLPFSVATFWLSPIAAGLIHRVVGEPAWPRVLRARPRQRERQHRRRRSHRRRHAAPRSAVSQWWSAIRSGVRSLRHARRAA